MAIIYLLGGLIILCVNITALPTAIWYIIKYAFCQEFFAILQQIYHFLIKALAFAVII